MKKGKRLSKADALRVLTKAYNLIKNDNYAFICIAIERTAIEEGSQKDQVNILTH